MSEPQGGDHQGHDPAWESRYERAAFLVMLVAFVAMPFVIYPRFGSQLLCFALFACAFNLLIGFGGLLSFGHAMFFGMGSYLAALAGVFAAPIYQVSPQMGSSLIIVVFAVVVIGGMGSIMGSIVTGFGLGVVEGLTKYFYPEASNTVIFVIMAIVLMIRPQGLFGQR